MAGVKKSDIPEIASFMTDIWAFMKSVWIPEDNDEYWEFAMNRAIELGEKHRHDFCIACINFVLDYLDWRHKKNKGQTEYSFNSWLYKRYAERGRRKG